MFKSIEYFDKENSLYFEFFKIIDSDFEHIYKTATYYVDIINMIDTYSWREFAGKNIFLVFMFIKASLSDGYALNMIRNHSMYNKFSEEFEKLMVLI
jgi:hypothetical protein